MIEFAKKIYRRLRYFGKGVLGVLRSPLIGAEYCIKRGYTARTTALHFDDTGATDEGQKEVYIAASCIMRMHDLERVLDVGCGSGFKLIKYMGHYETAGVDVPSTYGFLIENYPDKIWYSTKSFDYTTAHPDIVVCADAIEHVANPDRLLDCIKSIRELKFVVFSTPERDMCRGRYHYGPPGNPTHYREWNAQEFHDYISQHFSILSHQISSIKQSTQMIVCAPKPIR